MVDNYQQKIVALDAVTATTTSEIIPCKGAKKITIVFTRSAHGSGSTAFTVPISVDDTTYADCAVLISNVANTNSQTLTRVASATISSNASTVVAVDMDHFCFSSLKVTATETTDGAHSATVYIEY